MSEIKTKTLVEDGRVVSYREQDVEPYLDNNHLLRSIPQKRAETFRHVATIPNVIIEKWIAEEGAPVLRMSKFEFDRFIRQKLRDNEWHKLKTTDGKL